jgi:arsenate reductase-like glutaredoxin family protein
MPNDQPQSHLDQLKSKYQHLEKDFGQRHKKARNWLQANSVELEEFRHLSKQILASVSLAGQIAMSQPVEARVQQQLQTIQQKQKKELLDEITKQEYQDIVQKMLEFTQMPPGHLPEDDELYLEQQLTDVLGFDVTAELGGHRLNHTIGVMGGEQHLRRHPTDTLNDHDAYLEAGLAPKRGAFGWFTENGQLTPQAVLREKYYFAVQTLYLPDWNENYQQLKPWYKFRKMIVINPAEQKAVVGVVGDAGPALWVKKQFGGSPEVIRQAKIWSPKTKGRVLLFFVDDPNNEVPLGVINLDWEPGSAQE